MRTRQRHGVIDATTRKTERLNVRIDTEALKRLRVHSAMSGLSPGEILTRLCEGLREFSMPAKLSDRPDKSHRLIQSVEVRETATPDAAQVAA